MSESLEQFVLQILQVPIIGSLVVTQHTTLPQAKDCILTALKVGLHFVTVRQ